MGLPVVPLDTGTVEVGGQQVHIRSLSRAEVTELAGFGDDAGGAEVFVISRATGESEADAAEWRKTVSAKTADVLLKAVRDLSGLTPGKAAPSSSSSSAR